MPRRDRERGRQQFETEVGVKDRRSRREQERVPLQPLGEGGGRNVEEGVVRRAGLMRRLARKPGRMVRKVDEPNGPPGFRQGRGEVGNRGRERIGEADDFVGREARKDLACEGLGDRADAKDRGAVRFGARALGACPEAVDRGAARAKA